jgi:hypothetical protein
VSLIFALAMSKNFDSNKTWRIGGGDESVDEKSIQGSDEKIDSNEKGTDGI